MSPRVVICSPFSPPQSNPSSHSLLMERSLNSSSCFQSPPSPIHRAQPMTSLYMHNSLTPNPLLANYSLQRSFIPGLLAFSLHLPLTPSLDSYPPNIIPRFQACAHAVSFTWKNSPGGAHVVVQVVSTIVYTNDTPCQCTTSATFQRWLVSILLHLQGLLRTFNSIVDQLYTWLLHHQLDTLSSPKKKLQYLEHQQCLEHSRYLKDACKLQRAKLRKANSAVRSLEGQQRSFDSTWQCPVWSTIRMMF